MPEIAHHALRFAPQPSARERRSAQTLRSRQRWRRRAFGLTAARSIPYSGWAFQIRGLPTRCPYRIGELRWSGLSRARLRKVTGAVTGPRSYMSDRCESAAPAGRSSRPTSSGTSWIVSIGAWIPPDGTPKAVAIPLFSIPAINRSGGSFGGFARASQAICGDCRSHRLYAVARLRHRLRSRPSIVRSDSAAFPYKPDSDELKSPRASILANRLHGRANASFNPCALRCPKRRALHGDRCP